MKAEAPLKVGCRPCRLLREVSFYVAAAMRLRCPQCFRRMEML